MNNTREMGPSERYGAVRVSVREVPLGPMPGFARVIPRCIVTILIPDTLTGDEALREIAIEQKDRVLSFGKDYCAMAFHFWTEEQRKAKVMGKEEAAAVIDYAPGGEWADALLSSIGDYTKHAFKKISNKMKEAENGTREADD